MVELRGAGYRVDDTTLLHDVSVRFRPGTLNVILGPNGAGKSTLLRLATGLLSPTWGEVRYEERPLASIPVDELARRRGVLSQRVELAFPLPVADVVLMGRYPHYGRVPSALDRDVVRRALALVDMTERAGQSYATLSGGERQKVQLARVLAQIWRDDGGAGDARSDAGGHHRYLFLDEPTSGLDVHYQLHLLQVARGLVAHDCTVVAILHDLNMALRHGGHFVLLDRGRVALEADGAHDVSADAIEQVFRVRAERVDGARDGQRDVAPVWRFSL